MIRAWIAVGLLAGSWMFGLDYFCPANPWICAALVVGGTVLLGGSFKRFPRWSESTIALMVLVPAIYLVPWPYKIIPLLIALGLAGHLLPIPGNRIRWLSQGAVSAGVIMAAQSLILALYTAQTARSHDLPKPLPDLLAGMAKLFSIDTAVDGSKIVMHSIRQVHRLAATWELLIDPATLCFFFGGVVLLALTVWQNLPDGKRWSEWIRAIRIFTVIIIAWLPVRAGLLMAIYMYRVLRAEPDRALYVMNHFFAPWSLLVLLAVPVLIIWRFLQVKGMEPSAESAESVSNTDRWDVEPVNRAAHIGSIVLIALAVIFVTAGVLWNPVGKRMAGRVKVVERHSTWEPTTREYDTSWYGEPSGYNYAAVYAYLGQYFEMSRLLETDKIDDKTLGQCDVLVIKTPTSRYSQDEVNAVLRFVERGGGLMVIGDHTNIYRTGTIMNDMTQPMGFIFRDDLLFSNEASAYDQHFELPMAAHPSLQYMPPMDFAVSCSIDPGFSSGRSVITSTGLWNMPPDYHMENYHPVAQYCPEMRYGPFVQVWAAWYGQGRAMAFTDSTIFSNFAVFQPGKAELMLGMIEWLNHANPVIDPRPWLLLLGGISLVIGLILARRTSVAWLMLLAVGIFVWALSVEGVAALHRWSMPLPKLVNPMTRIVIDRTTSDVLLSKGAYTQGDGIGYGMMEQLIARLGCYTIRKEGQEAFSGDALVVICPSRPVDAAFRERLERYVAEGGKLLVFDAPENTNSTANSLLSPFGLSIDHKKPWQGTLTIVDNWPGIEVTQANQVDGGKAIAFFAERPVAAIAQHGKGKVLAVGFASLLSDKNMGDVQMWMVEPDTAMLARYDVLYALVRLLVENKAIESTANIGGSTSPMEKVSPRSQPTLQLPELPIKELGPQE